MTLLKAELKTSVLEGRLNLKAIGNILLQNMKAMTENTCGKTLHVCSLASASEPNKTQVSQ